MVTLDILNLIPPGFQAQVISTLVGLVSGLATEVLGDRIANKIDDLEQDAAFRESFHEGLPRAAARFIREYELEDGSRFSSH